MQTQTLKSLSWQEILDPIAKDFETASTLLQQQLQHDIPIIGAICTDITRQKSKRIRPLLLLLSARALGYKNQQHCHLAMALELIHNATLLHDDVVDVSLTRRGEPSAHIKWSNAKAVLCGDFLYAQAFEVLSSIEQHKAIAILTKTMSHLAQGEVEQMLAVEKSNLDKEGYLAIINAKTASLFEVAAHLSAEISPGTLAQKAAIVKYCKALGMAFQIIDDLLDYYASASQMGKNAGDDLIEGKITLPLILAFEQASPKEHAFLKKAIRQKKNRHLKKVIEIFNHYRIYEQTINYAKKYTQEAIDALSVLEESPYKSSLIALAHFTTQRDF